MMPSAPSPLLVLGWDAADWLVMDPLLAAGRMPSLARLIERGSRDRLRTLEPKLSPLLWSTIATGRFADAHGILNFVEPKPDGAGVRVVSSTSRRVKALWNIVSQSGRRVGVVGWYASHPAEPVNGAVVSNVFMEDGSGESVHPAALRGAVRAACVSEAMVTDASLRPYFAGCAVPPRTDERMHTLVHEVARMRSLHAATLALVEATATPSPLDCLMVFHDTIDTVGHRFMECRAPKMSHVSAADQRRFGAVMDALYIEHDRLLGDLLDAMASASAGAPWSVLLVSDHGFHSAAERPVIVDVTKEERAAMEARWHREHGIVVASGPLFAIGGSAAGACVADVTPTALAAMGLPVGRDMDGRVMRGLLARGECVRVQAPAGEIAFIDSWESVEEGDAGLHSPEKRLDPFEAHEALKQLVDLGYMAALPEDAQAQVELVRRESFFNRAVVLMSTGRPGAAIESFRPLVAERATESRYVLPLARCLMMAGRDVEAAGLLGRFTAATREANLERQLLLVVASARAGRADESRALSSRLEQEPECAAGASQRATLAEAALVRSEPHEALRLLGAAGRAGRASAAPSEAIPARLARVRAQLALREWELAAELCLDVLDVDPSQPDANYLVALAVAWLDGNGERSTPFIDAAMAHRSGWVDAVALAAALARHRGDAAEARRFADALAGLVERARAGGLAPAPREPWDADAWTAAHGPRSGA